LIFNLNSYIWQSCSSIQEYLYLNYQKGKNAGTINKYNYNKQTHKTKYTQKMINSYKIFFINHTVSSKNHKTNDENVLYSKIDNITRKQVPPFSTFVTKKTLGQWVEDNLHLGKLATETTEPSGKRVSRSHWSIFS